MVRICPPNEKSQRLRLAQYCTKLGVSTPCARPTLVNHWVNDTFLNWLLFSLTYFKFITITQGAQCLTFLTDALLEISENFPLAVRQDIIFQHDRFPAHRSAVVVQFLNEQYGEQWIGYKTINQRH